MVTIRLPLALLAWLVVLAAPTTAWWLATRTWQWGQQTGWEPATMDEAVTLMAGLVGCAVAAYLTVSTVAMLATRAATGGSRSWAERITPALWRRVVATALSAGMATGVTAPALATDADADYGGASPAHAGWVDTPADAAVTTSRIEPSPSPAPAASASPAPTGSVSAQPAVQVSGEEDPAGTPEPVAATLASSPSTSTPTDAGNQADEADGAQTYTVERGDSLWRITAQLLGSDADNHTIAEHWPLLYRANKEVIGDNPSLIHPGQELTIPEELAA